MSSINSPRGTRRPKAQGSVHSRIGVLPMPWSYPQTGQPAVLGQVAANRPRRAREQTKHRFVIVSDDPRTQQARL